MTMPNTKQGQQGQKSRKQGNQKQGNDRE